MICFAFVEWIFTDFKAILKETRIIALLDGTLISIGGVNVSRAISFVCLVTVRFLVSSMAAVYHVSEWLQRAYFTFYGEHGQTTTKFSFSFIK